MVQITRVLVEFAGVGERIPASLLVHCFPVGHDLIYARSFGSAGVASQFAFCYFGVAEVTLISVLTVGVLREEFHSWFMALVVGQDVLSH